MGLKLVGTSPNSGVGPSVLGRWSIEATLPGADDVELLARLVPAGTEVFLSTLPHVGLERQVEIARQVRAATLEPVPHIAARFFADADALDGFLRQLAGAAEVRSVLIVGGDLEEPRGSFRSSLEVVESGLLRAHGIETVGFAGYPDGHPKIPDEALEQALDDKVAAATAAGLTCRVVTQFCFRSKPILDWLARFRARHPDVEVRVGLAGPASINALVRYAIRCGVGVPSGDLGHKLSMATKLARGLSPAGIVSDLDAAETSGGGAAISTHFFSFGGLERTARWAIAAASGDLH